MHSFFAQLPLVVSFYTRNTPYEEEANNLRSSCEQKGIACYIEGVDDLGSWEENCMVKPYFMRTQLHKWKRPLLWVDADAVFLQPLCFEEFMFSDLAILKYKEEEDPRFCVGAGTMYVNATEGGVQGMDLWCFYADQIRKEKGSAPPFADQVSLYLTLRSQPPITIAPMPLKYCAIFDQKMSEEEAQEIIIEQRQASRKWR